MADSQNTYQNDVKIKSENSFGKVVLGIIAAAIIGFGGYYVYDTGVTASYEEGYSAGQDEGYNRGEKSGYNKGYEDGKEDGYDSGYDDGFEDGKESAKSNSSKSSSGSNNSSKNNSNSSSNNYSSNNEKVYDYVLNKNTKKFHYSWCYSVDQMKEKNKIYATDTRTAIINRGYSPCGNCHP